MSRKHTPGPWFTDGTDIRKAKPNPTDGSWRIATLQSDLVTDAGESMANAQLLAAAPELLTAAQNAIATLNRGSGKQAALRAINYLQMAIAKATGGQP